MKKQRRTFRLWLHLEEQLEAKAREMNLTPAKALNVIVAQALGAPPEEEFDDVVEEQLPPIANHDAF